VGAVAAQAGDHAPALLVPHRAGQLSGSSLGYVPKVGLGLVDRSPSARMSSGVRAGGMGAASTLGDVVRRALKPRPQQSLDLGSQLRTAQ
jgi:hypothetical protein